jgi:hypothetical protein
MIDAIGPHALVSLYRFHMLVAACFSRDGARKNRVIQSQLVEISAVFCGGWEWPETPPGKGVGAAIR